MGKYIKTRRPPTSRHENFLVEVSELIGFKSYHVVRHILIIFTFLRAGLLLRASFFHVPSGSKFPARVSFVSVSVVWS